MCPPTRTLLPLPERGERIGLEVRGKGKGGEEERKSGKGRGKEGMAEERKGREKGEKSRKEEGSRRGRVG